MSSFHLHKRYLTYINRTSNPRTDYPRVISGTLRKLNSKIPDSFWQRDYTDEKILCEVFIPDNLKNIDIRYYRFLLYASKYFDCIIVWKNHLLEGGTPIRTFEIWGCYNDIKLCHHYIGNIINSFNHVKEKKQEQYRYEKNLARNQNTIKFYKTADARTKAIKFISKHIDRIAGVFQTLYMKRYSQIEINHKKFLYLFNIMNKKIKFDYRNYKNLNHTHTFSRKDHFEPNRIIR